MSDDTEICAVERRHPMGSSICDREKGHKGNHQQKAGLKIPFWWVNADDHKHAYLHDESNGGRCIVCDRTRPTTEDAT